MTSHAAASTSDALQGWQPAPASPDADYLSEKDTIVGRARDLFRNNGVAQGALRTQQDNVVGTGLRLSARPMYKLLGRDKAWARDYSQTVEGFHRLWWDDTSCDAADECNGAGLTTQALGSLFMNGEACALPMWLPEPGQLFATRLHLFEPDRLSNPGNKPDTATLRAGIERHPVTGRPVAAHIRTTHPGDRYLGLGQAFNGEWERVEFRTQWGRRRFLHVHDKDRIGATRGKPLVAAVMRPFKQVDHYLNVHLQTAITQSLIAAFVKTPLSQEALVDLFGGDAESAKTYFEAKAATDRRVRLKGGAIIPLNPGDDVVPFTPPNAANGVDIFVMTVYRQIAAALQMPYELLMKDFTRSNYSSARAAMLEAWRYFNYLRAKLGFMFCQPAYELVLEEMVDRALIDAPDFYTLRRAYAASRWIGPGRGWVDEVKEATAAKIRMDNGLSTLEMEAAQQGLDWEEVLEQQALENDRRRELGLPIPQPAGINVAVNSQPEPEGNDGSNDNGNGNSNTEPEDEPVPA
jgi:lambda family phage portal protein